jgi:hypothetical protein
VQTLCAALPAVLFAAIFQRALRRAAIGRRAALLAFAVSAWRRRQMERNEAESVWKPLLAQTAESTRRRRCSEEEQRHEQVMRELDEVHAVVSELDTCEMKYFIHRLCFFSHAFAVVFDSLLLPGDLVAVDSKAAGGEKNAVQRPSLDSRIKEQARLAREHHVALYIPQAANVFLPTGGKLSTAAAATTGAVNALGTVLVHPPQILPVVLQQAQDKGKSTGSAGMSKGLSSLSTAFSGGTGGGDMDVLAVDSSDPRFSRVSFLGLSLDDFPAGGAKAKKEEKLTVMEEKVEGKAAKGRMPGIPGPMGRERAASGASTGASTSGANASATTAPTSSASLPPLSSASSANAALTKRSIFRKKKSMADPDDSVSSPSSSSSSSSFSSVLSPSLVCFNLPCTRLLFATRDAVFGAYQRRTAATSITVQRNVEEMEEEEDKWMHWMRMQAMWLDTDKRVDGKTEMKERMETVNFKKKNSSSIARNVGTFIPVKDEDV